MTEPREQGYQVKVDGRVVTYDVSGDDYGWPVVLLHGTPGSRIGPIPRPSVLYRLGVRLITYDRPGYGRSDRRPGREVKDAAQDVKAIIDDLELRAVSVVGRSGGGPHALACAALLPEVVRAAVLVGLAPPDADGLDWFAGMTDANVTEFMAARSDREEILSERLLLRSLNVAADPYSLLDLLAEDMTEPDRQVVDDPAIRQLLACSYQEALRAGPYGWIDDVLALRTPWGFDVRSIDKPVRLWHGEVDNFAPASHARWLAARLKHADVQIQMGTAHFGAIGVLPGMLSWLAQGDPHPSERVRVDDPAKVGALT